MEKAIGCFVEGCDRVGAHQYVIHVKDLLRFERVIFFMLLQKIVLNQFCAIKIISAMRRLFFNIQLFIFRFLLLDTDLRNPNFLFCIFVSQK